MIVKTDSAAYSAPDESFYTLRVARNDLHDARKAVDALIVYYADGVAQLPPDLHSFSDLEFIDEQTSEQAVPPQFTITRRYVKKGTFTKVALKPLT